jgi:hypothetical protein
MNFDVIENVAECKWIREKRMFELHPEKWNELNEKKLRVGKKKISI